MAKAALTEVEAGVTLTWIAEIDSVGHEMERPYMRVYVTAPDEATALATAERIADADEKIRRVIPFQPIIDAVIEGIRNGKRYSISWKHEGTEGPVVITDVDAMEAEFPPNENGVRILSMPFGTEPACDTVLPWMRRSEAKRLAKYLGLTLDES